MHEHDGHDHVDGPAASMDNHGVRPSLIIGIIVVIAAIVFVVQNREKAEVHFLFFTVTTPHLGRDRRRPRPRHTHRPTVLDVVEAAQGRVNIAPATRVC